MAITYAKNSCLIKTPPVIEIGNGVYTIVKVGNYLVMAEDLHEDLGTLGVDYVIGSNNGHYYYKAASIQSLLSQQILDGWNLPVAGYYANFFDDLISLAGGAAKIAANGGDSWPGTNETGLSFLPWGTAETNNNTPKNTNRYFLNPGSSGSVNTMSYSGSYGWQTSSVSLTTSRCYPVRLYRTIS